ncbi:MAG: hypothetical protein MI924_00145 [Chloroflexales bacterium]|nr:hypothetical protein [Chloroflexales bacterium]
MHRNARHGFVCQQTNPLPIAVLITRIPLQYADLDVITLLNLGVENWHARPQNFAGILHDLTIDAQTLIDHCQQDASDPQLPIEPCAFNHFHVVENKLRAFCRKILSLERDNNFLDRDECIDCQNPKIWEGIDDNKKSLTMI